MTRSGASVATAMVVLGGCAQTLEVGRGVGDDTATSDAARRSPMHGELGALVGDASTGTATSDADVPGEVDAAVAASPDLAPPPPDLTELPDLVELPDLSLVDYPLPPVPAGCLHHARVLTYNPRGWGHLLDAFEADQTPCADYYIFLPAPVADKTTPRGPIAPAQVRARAGRFFAVAEFHYGEWSKVAGMSWFDKGVEFRRRMDAQNYNTARGDLWAINELPSTVRSQAQARTDVLDLVRGLFTGPPGSMAVPGIVYVIGMGQGTMNFSVYKPNLENWTLDAAFWQAANTYVRWWGQETYTDPRDVCEANVTVGARAQRVGDYAYHPAALAGVAPNGGAQARKFNDSSYVPLMTAFWNSAAYGNTAIPLDQMKKHVSLQVYTARWWADMHTYPDWRVAFAWDDGAGAGADLDDLAARLASAISHAYSETNSGAPRACSPTGAFTWCDCTVAGAAWNDLWKTFGTW